MKMYVRGKIYLRVKNYSAFVAQAVLVIYFGIIFCACLNYPHCMFVNN